MSTHENMEKLKQFVSITGESAELALKMLQENMWDPQDALNNYYDEKNKQSHEIKNLDIVKIDLNEGPETSEEDDVRNTSGNSQGNEGDAQGSNISQINKGIDKGKGVLIDDTPECSRNRWVEESENQNVKEENCQSSEGIKEDTTQILEEEKADKEKEERLEKEEENSCKTYTRKRKREEFSGEENENISDTSAGVKENASHGSEEEENTTFHGPEKENSAFKSPEGEITSENAGEERCKYPSPLEPDDNVHIKVQEDKEGDELRNDKDEECI